MLNYVYIDSRDRNETEEVSDFRVQLHTPLKNVTRCGIVKFTKGNNSFNVHKDNNTIVWIEARKDGNIYHQVASKITIEPGYYSVVDLLTSITAQMTNMEDRTVNTEAKVTYTYLIDDDYKVKIVASSSNSPASQRWWGFYIRKNRERFKNSILHNILNFSRDQVLLTNVLIPTDVRYMQAWRVSQSNMSIASRTLVARFSYQENQSLIYIASDTLAQNSQRMIKKDDHSSTMNTNILEAIPITVNRWSYIQMNKSANDVLYHTLHNINLDSFDVKLTNEHYTMLTEGAESDYKMVLVFETLDDKHEEIKDMYKEFNQYAYDIAHLKIR